MADRTSKPIDTVKVGDKVTNSSPGATLGTADQVHAVTAVHVTHTDWDYTDVTVNTTHGPATITGTAHHLYCPSSYTTVVLYPTAGQKISFKSWQWADSRWRRQERQHSTRPWPVAAASCGL